MECDRTGPRPVVRFFSDVSLTYTVRPSKQRLPAFYFRTPHAAATAQLVQDACYLLRVPNVVPESPALAKDPVVLAMADFFTRPAPFQADVVLPTDAVLEQVVDLLACHESQVFEWLPFMDGQEAALAAADRRDWLRQYYGRRPAAIARRWAQGSGYAEAFEISEYGHRLPAGGGLRPEVVRRRSRRRHRPRGHPAGRP